MAKILPLTALLAAAAATALSGCATSEKSLADQGMKPLSEAEFKALYSRERSIAFQSASNVSGTATYRMDGSSELNWGTGGDKGRWRLQGNTLCAQYPQVRGGAEYCSRTYKTGDNEYKSFTLNGDPLATYRFTQ